MDWKSCCNRRIVKETIFDEPLCVSLQKSSVNKVRSVAQLPLNEVTAASCVSLSYDSIRELLEALALKRGFKVYNHECYTAFCKEILEMSSLGDEFDELRKIRNAVNYYGHEMDVVSAKEFMSRCEHFHTIVLGLL